MRSSPSDAGAAGLCKDSLQSIRAAGASHENGDSVRGNQGVIAMPSTLRAAVLLLAGLALSASSALHAFAGWPHLRGDLLEDHASRNLVAALSAGWHFGSLAMLAFGLIVLSAGVAAWQGRPVPSGPLWIVAAACIAFGAGAFFLISQNVHFAGFAAIGVLVAIGAGPGSGELRRPG
jgi:hypothetical protein